MESVNRLPFLKEKTILVIGATSFLAKVFVEKILRIQPNIKRLYLLVRAEDTKFAMQRVINEMVQKDLCRVLRHNWGSNLESFILEKVVAVAGDIKYANLGVRDSEIMKQMFKETDIVVNFAAATKFDERYDVAFGSNTMGPFNLLSFAKQCVKLKMIIHVSTGKWESLSVCRDRATLKLWSVLIPEKPFYNGETLKGTCELDITAEKKLLEEKLNQLQAEDATEEVVTSTMKILGTTRAKLYGWPNTYVFTKAMGEMMLGKYIDALPLIIIRPTMITSTYREPFPGWIEGLRTIDGPIVGYGKGKLTFLLVDPNTILDLIPADMVVNSMIMAMVANVEQSSQIIYQVGSSLRNPVKCSSLHEFTIRYFTEHPSINKNGKSVKLGKVTILKTPNSFRAYMAIRYVIPLKYKDVCIVSDRNIKFVMRLVELYKPYMLFKGIFDDTNSEELRMTMRETGREDDAFNFDPECIDWEEYIMNIHIPGLLRFVVKG